MTTINDIHDLVRIVEEHPEWRSELQRVLLTQELLEMPERLDTLAAVVENLAGTAAALLATVEATNRRLDGIDTRLDGIDTRLDSMNTRLDGMDTRLDGMEKDIREIHGITQTQHRDFENFRGQFAEEVAVKNVPSITNLVGQSIGKDLEDLDILTNEQRREWVSENREKLATMGLTRGDFISFRQSDITILARNERNYRDTCYIAVEVSYTCEPKDVTRVRRNLTIVETCSGVETFAVVAGIRINDSAAAMLESEDEPTVLWFQMEEQSLDT